MIVTKQPNKIRSYKILATLKCWQTRTHCCGHIVAHDVSWAAQTGKHLLRTQNVSEHNRKHFLCPGHKICVCNKCCARGQTRKHLCRQQCVHNNVSSFASTFRLLKKTRDIRYVPLSCGTIACNVEDTILT